MFDEAYGRPVPLKQEHGQIPCVTRNHIILYPNNTTKLKTNYLNTQSLRIYSDNAVFREYCKQIIALYETWQDDETDFKAIIDGYDNFGTMRKKKTSCVLGSGKVSAFVKDLVIPNFLISTYVLSV